MRPSDWRHSTAFPGTLDVPVEEPRRDVDAVPDRARMESEAPVEERTVPAAEVSDVDLGTRVVNVLDVFVVVGDVLIFGEHRLIRRKRRAGVAHLGPRVLRLGRTDDPGLGHIAEPRRARYPPVESGSTDVRFRHGGTGGCSDSVAF